MSNDPKDSVVAELKVLVFLKYNDNSTPDNDQHEHIFLFIRVLNIPGKPLSYGIILSIC